MTSRLSTKGRLTVPKTIRARHGWKAGSELVIEDRGEFVAVRSAESIPDTIPEMTLDQLIGCTGYTGPRRSLKEQEAAIAKRVRSAPSPRRRR
jgi:AbrB family looped-hinge helix DNA binding protein